MKLTIAELAEKAAVSRQAVHKAIRKGRLPEPIDGKLDIGHPDALAFLERHHAQPAESGDARAKTSSSSPRKTTTPSRSEAEIRKIEAQAFHVELKNRERIGELCRREDVERGLVNPIVTTFVRLMSDTAKSMAGQIVPLVNGGATTEEIEDFIREQHASVLKNLKKKMARALGEQGPTDS
jgi:hypothetical protein